MTLEEGWLAGYFKSPSLRNQSRENEVCHQTIVKSNICIANKRASRVLITAAAAHAGN